MYGTCSRMCYFSSRYILVGYLEAIYKDDGTLNKKGFDVLKVMFCFSNV